MERLGVFEQAAIAALTLAVVAATVLWIGRDNARFARLARAAVVFTFFVVVVGAFVRLNDAGLGCPDWPGCYGKLTPESAQTMIGAQEHANPFGPITMAKAWKEMFHRYIAATLGALLIGLAIAAWHGRRAWRRPAWLATSAVGVIALQGAFGAWTVTLLLKPAIVTGHLIGGMLTLSLLLLLALSASAPPRFDNPVRIAALRPLALAALVAVCIQIVLGGWTSTNYAALACADWPLCQSQAIPSMQFADAFHLFRPLGMTAAGAPLSFEALTAIHWVHRSFAYVVLILVATLAMRLRGLPRMRGLGSLALALVIVQVGLGISNVLLGLPLAVAVAHNGGAAALLLTMVAINHRVAHAARQAGPETLPGPTAAATQTA